MQAIISCKDLHKSFGSQHVLRGLSLDIEPDSVTVIIGRSGGGKSVLLKHIVGLMKPDSGEVRIEGQDITGLSVRDMADVRRGFGLLFQEGALFDSMTVEDNVAFPLREHSGLRNKEILDIVARKLSSVGLADAGHKMPAELSGGMRKRVGLARAIALDPKIVLFDEPTSGLDPVMSAAINELILRTRDEFGATCVVISHDIQATMAIADTIYMLYEGQIIARGTPEEIRANQNPVVRQFIEGRADGPIGLE
ncbi:ABC transporter ATP-binding protein [Desulfobaculum bizertense]|uniref:Phospholipid/cholesterol/gamma-HCH transport system ATP-binding protein n=1 Tax=Desulfobaculum bizertense DSM 18034 TaxID=1121442 RepID=A0A1T4VI60_9BACT|nr:ABC transporter ATP-binding protein [Desulfobaculum bizertense]UIJ37895.1 ABC transporter ATP-binding protein [Desulfobaculum bizertense]SKA64619.1 phospholipid/cholesterol/gamma-HCH transport system ATP-binding protein [Desulfobaculum bizertense DSM 18034]